jgi:hypothetical protein
MHTTSLKSLLTKNFCKRTKNHINILIRPYFIQNVDIVATERCSLGKSFTLTLTADLVPNDGVTAFETDLGLLLGLFGEEEEEEVRRDLLPLLEGTDRQVGPPVDRSSITT